MASYDEAIKDWMSKMEEGTAWVGFDLDGSIAHYDRWHGHTHIGKPIPAAIKKIKAYLAQGYRVKIVTARMSVPEQAEEMARLIAAWTLKHVGVALEATCSKDYNMIRLYDDRCVQLVPNTGLTLAEIQGQQENQDNDE